VHNKPLTETENTPQLGHADALSPAVTNVYYPAAE
jgi:hypothetical protein